MKWANIQILLRSSHSIHTMYTNHMRARQEFILDAKSVSAAIGDEVVGTLTELLKKTWTIFGVSTLFNFHQEEVFLKKYAKRLREEVACSLAQEDVIYTTEFRIVNNISTLPSPTDSPPIKVAVFSEKNNDDNGVKKCIYIGMFLSWRTTRNTLTIPNAVRLPLLLCRGTQSAIGIVHNMFRRMFDCTIIALPAKEDDLMWLVPIVITPINKEKHSKSTDEIRMEYKIPELPDRDTITIKFQISDLLKILTVITKDQNDEENVEFSFNLDHIEKLREVLYTEILKAAGIQLGFCTLCKISLPAFAIMENKVKVTTIDAMNRVLLYFNEKAVDTLHTFNFEV